MVFFAESNLPANATCAAGKFLTASGFFDHPDSLITICYKHGSLGFFSGKGERRWL